MQQSTVSEAVVAGQPAADCKNVDGGSTQETAVLETDCSGSPGAALNVGPTQGMVAFANRLGIRVAAPNVSPTRLRAQPVGRSVGWLVSQPVGRQVSQIVWEASRLH
jgi:hypothetical protein